MKLTTVTHQAIEMTRQEYSDLCQKYRAGVSLIILGKKVEDWDMAYGHQSILLEGETIYRVVVIKGELGEA